MNKRDKKEDMILDAAEVVFKDSGLEGAKMEDIAKELDMSKGSIYFYFDSKDTLKMALTYRALHALLDMFYDSIEELREAKRYDAIVEVVRRYMDFASEEKFYFDLIQDYTRLIRRVEEDSSMLDKWKDNRYYRRCMDVQNLPLKIFAEEIGKGQLEGSISSSNDPGVLFLSIWSLVAGFSELRRVILSPNKATIYSVSEEKWRENTLGIIKTLLKN